MSDKRYNGWTTYETWLVALWTDNDQASYRYWQRMAQKAWDDTQADSTFSREERATMILADTLETETQEANPLADDASLWNDLMGAALAEVNWHEIAEHLIEDVEKCLPSTIECDSDGSK
jgi:hypothetical protein